MAERISIRVDNHSGDVMAEVERKIRLALSSMGEIIEGYAKDDCPVDTGRLRNSITYATSTTQGHGSGEDSSPHATPEEHTVYIGTNVEYAPYVELKDMRHVVGKAHFIRDAAANHGAELKETTKAILGS